MKRTLRIIAISAGIMSVASAVVLGCVYLENIVGYVNKIKFKISNKIGDTKFLGEKYGNR